MERLNHKLVFWGDDHNPIDIQAVNQILTAFKTHLQQGYSRNIYYVEGGAQTTESLKNMQRQRELDNSLAAPILRNAFLRNTGQLPSQEILDKYLQFLHNPTEIAIEMMFNERRLPFTNIRDYSVLAGIDELNRSFEIEISGETHDGKKFEQIQQVRRNNDTLYYLSMDQFRQGDYHAMVDSTRSYYRSIYYSVVLRETDIYEQIRDFFRRGSRLDKPTLVFMQFGGTHEPLIDRLSGSGILSRTVEFQVQNKLRSTPVFTIFSLLRKGELVPDLSLARDRFQDALFHRLTEYFQANKRLAVLALNYDLYFTATSEVANNLNEEDLQNICEKRLDPLHVLKTARKDLLLS